MVGNSIFIQLIALNLIADHICEVKTMAEGRHLTMIRWSGEILVTLIVCSECCRCCCCFFGAVCVCVCVLCCCLFFLGTSVFEEKPMILILIRCVAIWHRTGLLNGSNGKELVFIV